MVTDKGTQFTHQKLIPVVNKYWFNSAVDYLHILPYGLGAIAPGNHRKKANPPAGVLQMVSALEPSDLSFPRSLCSS